MTGFEPRPDTLYPAVWLGRDRDRFADFMAAEFPRGATGTPGHACVGPITYHGPRERAARPRQPQGRGRGRAGRGSVLHRGRARERRL